MGQAGLLGAKASEIQAGCARKHLWCDALRVQVFDWYCFLRGFLGDSRRLAYASFRIKDAHKRGMGYWNYGSLVVSRAH